MTRRPSRRELLALAGSGAVVLAGCIGGGDDDAREEAESGPGDDSGGSQAEGNGNSADTDGSTGSESNGEESASTPDSEEYTLPLQEPTVPLQHSLDTFEQNAVDGGPGKDGIPSIDDPTLGDAAAGDGMMDPGDPVFGVKIDDTARAYPQHVLSYHEIVNDSVGGRNVAVTYCPLTGTAIGFDRGDVEFGVSGMLVSNNLIMYDRATDTWWPQILGVGVLGELTGMALQELPVVWTTWERWRDEHPDTQVLTEETDYARNYDRDPYGSYNPRDGYYDNDRNLFNNLHTDDRFHEKAVFIGARSADGAIAFEKDRLRDEHLVGDSVGGVPYLAAYDGALDTAYVYRNPEELSFQPTGEGYEGPDSQYAADELPLSGVNAFDAMWFAWVGFYPETVVVA